jgi:putative transposase
MISFKFRHFQKEAILLSVRWYISYALSYRDLEEMMLERGMEVDHSTIQRWVVYYAPKLEEKFRKNYKKKVGGSWRMDETYIKIKGVWYYLYRAVDKEGKTIDFMLSKNRDTDAAKSFFIKAIGNNELPEKITIDKSGANNAGISAINLLLTIFSFFGLPFIQIIIRQIKYLNNIVEQDHRGIKKITKPMMGFKAFHSASSTLAGIELWRMLKKNQHANIANQNIFEQFYSLAG